jgi:hypothetical protein
MLSVGARALSKHCHRSIFWGSINGLTDQQKNELASEKLHTILDEAAWINVH